MHRFIHAKSLLRRPLNSLLLFSLIGLLSFSFVSRAVEYIIVKGETESLSSYYRSIGMLTKNEVIDDNYDILDGADLLSSSAYIDFEDRRRMASGVLHGMYNPDVDGGAGDRGSRYSDNRSENLYPTGVHVSDVWLTGNIESIIFLESRGDHGAYVLTVLVDEVLTGFPEYAVPDDTVSVYYFLRSPVEKDYTLNDISHGDRVFLRTFFDPFSSVIFSLGNTWSKAKNWLFLRPIDDAETWFYSLAKGESFDIDAPEYSHWKAEFNRIKTNQRAVMLYSTKDMSAMPTTQEDSRWLYLTEGRWLNRNDDLNARNVCVIHQWFAELRGLSIGDTLKLTIRDFGKEIHYYGYMTGANYWGGGNLYDDWLNFPTAEIELEIVGIYGIKLPSSSGLLTSYGLTVYIPDSVMPEAYNEMDELYMDAYSFVLKSFRDQDAFTAEYEDVLAGMGISLSFIDSNAENFLSSVWAIMPSVLFNFIIFSLAAVAGFGLMAFIYLYTGWKNFAILRALGMPRRKIGAGLVITALAPGLIGILAGGISAWNYAQGKALKTLSFIEYPDGTEPAILLSRWWLILLSLALLLVLLCFLSAGTWVISKRSVIEMLQGIAARRVKKWKNIDGVPGSDVSLADSSIEKPESGSASARIFSTTNYVITNSVASHKRLSLAVTVRFIWRHIFRAPLKSFLVILLTAGLIIALGWMLKTIEQNEAEMDRLMKTVPIDFDIVMNNPTVSYYGSTGPAAYGAFIGQRLVSDILSSGQVVKHELYSGIKADFLIPVDKDFDKEDVHSHNNQVLGHSFAGLKNIESFYTYRNMSELTIEYTNGSDASLFAAEWTALKINLNIPIPVIFPESLMEQLSLQLGDRVYYAHATKNNENFSAYFSIEGVYSDKLDRFNEALIPLSALESLYDIMEYSMLYSAAYFTFDPKQNRELPAFRADLEEWLQRFGAGAVPLRAIFWDEELRLAIAPLEQTVSLLKVLFPVTVVVAVLLGTGLSILLLLLSAKEAAYLRVLGMTRRRVQLILCSQVIVLCLLGLGISFIGVVFIFGAAVFNSLFLLCAGLYLGGMSGGAIFTSINVTRQKPIELLQVKE